MSAHSLARIVAADFPVKDKSLLRTPDSGLAGVRQAAGLIVDNGFAKRVEYKLFRNKCR
jgi:hypothetical protein